MRGSLSRLLANRWSRRQVRAGPRNANYETTVAAARRMPVGYPISYEEALAAARLPEHPPDYDDIVNNWPYRYPASRDTNGEPIGPPPRYDERRERAADPETPPSYSKAMMDAASAIEKQIRNFSQNMGVHLKEEFLLPFPGETDISEAGGARREPGRLMALVRSTRLARQAERLAHYRRGLNQLRQRLDQLSVQLEDPETLDRLRGAHASVAAKYASYERAYQSPRPSRTEMPPLARWDIPFERWEKQQGHPLLRDAQELYYQMRIDLFNAFSQQLPRARGIRAHFSLPRARREELRHERARLLERQRVVLERYSGQSNRLWDEGRRQETLLRTNPELWNDLDGVLAEIVELYIPYQTEYDRQRRR